MADNLPSNPNPGGPSQGNRFAPGWRSRQRAASVTLRQDSVDPDDPSSMMDPATKSLSDALKITYRFVQGAMVVLVGIYVLSGFRKVDEGERGIRLLFGRVLADDIGPGFRFSWPEPFGELVKVRTGAQSLTIEDDFFPQLTAEEKKSFKDQGSQALANGGYNKLNPEVDGSMITGDGSIAHTRWAVTYHRDDPKRVEGNIDPDAERSIVLSACKRGIVQAVASVSVDELLKNSADKINGEDRPGYRSVESRAREVAQRTLDQMESGLRIDIMSMTAKIPPRRVISAFNQVQSSVADFNKLREDAATEQKRILTDTAGEAAEEILGQIRKYEQAIELKQDDEAAKILATIDSLLVGDPVKIDGADVKVRVYGQVSAILSEAKSSTTQYVQSAESEAKRFAAKLEVYRELPTVLVNTEWADAYATVIARPNLQSMVLPDVGPDGRFVIMVNRDPEIVKQQVTAYNKAKAEEAQRARLREIENQRFREKVDPASSTRHD